MLLSSLLRFTAWVTLLCCLGAALPTDAEARRRRRRPRTTKAQRAAAKAYAKGNRLFGQRDYLGALEAFEQAYRLRPHFLMQCNIARTHERLTDMIRATTHYQRCLDEGAGRRRRTAAKVRRALELVKARVSQINVTAPGGGTVYVDGKRIGPAPQRIPLNPGSRVIEVRRAGARPASTTLVTRGGELRNIVLRPQRLARPPIVRPADRDDPPISRSAPRRRSSGLGQIWFWVGVVVTAGMATGASILGFRALSARDDYEENPTRDGYLLAQDRRLLANIFWAATIAAAGGTTALFFFTDFGGGRPRDRDQATAPRTFGIGLRGTF